MSHLLHKEGTLSVAELYLLTTQPVFAIVGIRSALALRRLSNLLLTSPAHAGALTDLTIRLTETPARPAVVRLLCECANLESLSLLLPSTFNTAFLSTIVFPKLQVFESNIPHTDILPFLVRHPGIQIVSLSACDRPASCPLAAVVLPQLRSISCPLACASPFYVSRNLASVTAKCTRRADIIVSPSSILRCLSLNENLTVVSLAFNPSDFDILHRLAISAPHLVHLRLIERSANSGRRGESSRREWNNWHTWSRDLHALRFLETLRLRTALSLVRVPGSRIWEEKMVTRWGTRPNGLQHPRLGRITVWYLSVGNKGVMSTWNGGRRNGNRWYRSEHTIAAPTSDETIDDFDFST
ncbi:hypothetical protein PLICRDRAFT_176648 [Plicaturopsis crispa FD-325 SS-3]|nr:hypothetical protein PLICRDRAFT_176648 [Plicaturopsis crispa FD-325 SS-3]